MRGVHAGSLAQPSSQLATPPAVCSGARRPFSCIVGRELADPDDWTVTVFSR